jgi:predicted house-cleaning noncanonical NTP pyrophosphatase (MazG superfamily)
MLNKLVRDNIPEIIKKAGKVPITHIASDEEYWKNLKEKLLEEVNEFCEDSSKDEMADILDVINAIYDLKKFYKKELEILRLEKAKEKVEYKNKIILDRIESCKI